MSRDEMQAFADRALGRYVAAEYARLATTSMSRPTAVAYYYRHLDDLTARMDKESNDAVDGHET